MGLNRTLPASYRFDRFTLDLVRGALLVSDGVELPLRPKSFALLQLLVENAGRLLDRDTIMQAIWPDVFVTDDSITQRVRDIRRVLGEEAHGLLRTVPRRGYLFTAEVSRASYAAASVEELSRLSAAHPAPHALAFASLSDEQGPARRDDTPEDLVYQPDPDSPPGPAPRFPIQRSLLENAVDRTWFRPVSEQAEPIGLSSSPGAERRQVTILYCGLVGLNALSEQLDAEDLCSVLRVYHKLCAAAITRGGGHVASSMGDGVVVAYFGYPQAYEDAAEQAVRSGLALVEAISDLQLEPNVALQSRVGIATGLVVTEPGEITLGEVAIGKPLNLAVQLQLTAEPGTVIIADSTRRLVGELFGLEALVVRH